MTNPVHKIRNGSLSVTIWRNKGEKKDWYSVKLTRSYKQNEEWKEADTLGFDDLLLASKLLDHAHSWIMNLTIADKQGKKEAA